jgi:hypothetical protein
VISGPQWRRLYIFWQKLIQLALDTLSMFEDRIDTVTNAIKQLYYKKFAINYFSDGEILWVNQWNSCSWRVHLTAKAGIWLVPYWNLLIQSKFCHFAWALSKTFNIFHTIYRHLSFPLPIAQWTTFRIWFCRNQSDLSFPSNNEALFDTDEHELITIGKNNPIKVISQVELASWILRNHVDMCDIH